jgi:hypothetical protein
VQALGSPEEILHRTTSTLSTKHIHATP